MDDLGENTTVLSTLRSLNNFISQRVEAGSGLDAPASAQGSLQMQYQESMQLEERAERIRSKSQVVQVEREKTQMELSHKRARVELERAASTSARRYEREVDRNQELLTRIRQLQEREAEAEERMKEQLERHRRCRQSLDAAGQKLREKEDGLAAAGEVRGAWFEKSVSRESSCCRPGFHAAASCVRPAVWSRIQRGTGLAGAIVTEQTMQMAGVWDVDGLCQCPLGPHKHGSWAGVGLLAGRSLPPHLRAVRPCIVSWVVAAVPQLVTAEACGLTGWEPSSSQKLLAKLQSWERLEQTTGLNIRTPEDLSRFIVDLQQRELALQDRNNVITSSARGLEKVRQQLQEEVRQASSQLLEERKRRETQEALARRLQKRVLLLTKERDGMRAILGSYDSELTAAEYSPQLTRRMREAEDMVQKVHAHSSEMETFSGGSNGCSCRTQRVAVSIGVLIVISLRHTWCHVKPYRGEICGEGSLTPSVLPGVFYVRAPSCPCAVCTLLTEYEARGSGTSRAVFGVMG
ncbi:mitotic spindle assembly checkpoint protein MAD1 [Puma concolor]|uniref:Mitotic spindle assembly checkpoint protein MAD1 n=1 Tax=Puma concolor TaxID=9696 RepID=A0A6P6HT12_PUMCO|nr:mitotic spindle assembly checkpoint protein MAD1 [Puma concolor]